MAKKRGYKTNFSNSGSSKVKINRNINRTISKDLKDEKIMAFLATFLSIIGFIIVLISANKDKYVRFYAKQSLVVFITAIIAFLIGKITFFIPIIGNAIEFILNVAILVLWILSWVYALSGNIKYVPIIGKYGDYVDL